MSSTVPLVYLAGTASADMMSRMVTATKGVNAILRNYEQLAQAENDTNVAVANSETDPNSTTVMDSDGPMRMPVFSPSSHRHRMFFDEVAPDLPTVTHPLEYARMAYKVLYREYDEALRAREFLLDIRSHAENQLEQLDVIISLKKKAVQLRSRAVSSGPGLREVLDPSDGMDEAL